MRVGASGVNPLDTKILGIDLAGTVVELGPGVTRFNICDEVYGIVDVIFDTVGGSTLDDSFGAVRTYTGHVVSILGWGTHRLAPLSFRAATYSGVSTLLPLLTGQGRAHHGEILAAAELVDDGKLTPLLDKAAYSRKDVEHAHHAVESGTADGKVVIDLNPAVPKR